jgi:hypothetical protein
MKFAKEIMDHIKEHKYFLMFLTAYLGTGFYCTYRLFQLMYKALDALGIEVFYLGWHL